MKDYYELLEVSQNASDEVIARAYKVLAKKYHPDMNPENPAEAEEKFKEITEAYEILSDPDKKRDYDSKLSYEKNKKREEANRTSNREQYNNSSSNTTNSNEVAYTDMYEENLVPKVDVDRLDQILKEHENAVEQAYNDAYINALKSMGIEVRYKKTFKEKVRGMIQGLILIVIIAIVLFAFFQIPEVKQMFSELFDQAPFLKDIVNFIKGIHL